MYSAEKAPMLSSFIFSDLIKKAWRASFKNPLIEIFSVFHDITWVINLAILLQVKRTHPLTMCYSHEIFLPS